MNQELAGTPGSTGQVLPIHNAKIAEMFNRLADLLEIENANTRPWPKLKRLLRGR